MSYSRIIQEPKIHETISSKRDTHALGRVFSHGDTADNRYIMSYGPATFRSLRDIGMKHNAVFPKERKIIHTGYNQKLEPFHRLSIRVHG